MLEVVFIKGLSFIYPDGQPGLNSIDLVIRQGESVAIIGPNGAGKSTLLLHLNGILRGNSTVRILGMPLESGNLREIRKRVGLVFQNPDDQLFSATVFDDVAFGPINLGYNELKVKRCISKALAQVGLTGYEDRAPHHLSIGEKKRVSIATILALDPEIIVLDEPTSNLDPGGKWSLIDLLKELPVTKIIATHDLELAKALCTRTIVMDKGAIVEDGATKQILSDVDLLRAHNLAQ